MARGDPGGEVELTRGQHGRAVTVGRAGVGAVLSEGVMLEDGAHSTSGFSRAGATVWQINRKELDAVKEKDPDVFYRIVGHLARRLSERLKLANQRLATGDGCVTVTGVRLEHDSLGEREVPNSAYYGVQTLRAIENFPFSGIPIGHYEHFVRALACVKKAAASANAELGVLDGKIATAIQTACDEIRDGKLHDQFVVDMIQGGAGTSTNMNANEVIANRALELLGHEKGDYQFCHPNDHVNCSQSTNDAYPTAIKLGVWLTLRDALGALRELKTALAKKAAEFADVIKMGRTENQDAVPDDTRPGVRRVCRDDRGRHSPPRPRGERVAGNKHGRHCHRHRAQQSCGICAVMHRTAGEDLRGAGSAGHESGRGDTGFRRVRHDERCDEDGRSAAL